MDALPEALEEFCQTLGLIGTETIGNLLQTPETSLLVIRQIKFFARKVSQQSETDEERLAANTLYYVSIAHALVHHKTRITKYSYRELALKFTRLTEMDWTEPFILDLFDTAHKYCRTKFRSSTR